MADRYDELRAALDAMKATNSMVEATYWMGVIMRESEALLSERDSLLAALRSIHDAQAFGADAAALDDLIRDIRQAARAALTTKEG